MKKGFTLVEIMIVTAIFAVLMVSGTNVIMQVMQASRKAQVENEIHQNLSTAFETISRQVRKAACMSVTNNRSVLNLYQDTGCTSLLTSFTISSSGLSQGSTVITSPKVVIDYNTTASSPSFFELTNPKTVKTTIRMTSAGSGTRWDFTGAQTLSESVSIRQFVF